LKAARDVAVLRIGRTLRILRPMRMISRFLGLKIAFNSIISSTVYILVVNIVIFFGLGVFAILGRNLFTQCFYQCVIDGDW